MGIKIGDTLPELRGVKQETEQAGAYRVYQDPADLVRHLDEVGVRQAM